METMRDAAGPGDLVERLCRVTNEHDLQGVGACFAPDYRLEMPAHPSRDFVGREQVLRNWGQIFAAVPDIAVDASWVADDDAVWSEWEMRGTRRDGSPHLMRGVIIFRVRDGAFSSARFYVEPVERNGIGIDDAIREAAPIDATPVAPVAVGAPRAAVAAPGAGPEGTAR